MNITRLLFTGLALVGLVACAKSDVSSVSENIQVPKLPPLPSISEEDLRSWIQTLSSDEFEGRAPMTAGGERTVRWLEDTMRDIGLRPANGDSYRQTVPLVELTLNSDESTLFFATEDGDVLKPEYGPECIYWTKHVVSDVDLSDSELIFVGYGIVAPEYNWDDYAGIDVAGKTVVMLVNDPGFASEDPDLFKGRAMTYYGRWTYKFQEAARQGAAAAIVVHEEEPAGYPWEVVQMSWFGPQLDLKRADDGASRVAVEGWIHADVAATLFAPAGLDFQTLKASAHRRGFRAEPMGGLTATAHLSNSIRRDKSHNVVGYVKGRSLPDEFVIYTAHWDHLGKSTDQSMGDVIFNGAVDNATGVAAIMAIGKAFATAEQPPERSVMILAVTAEESGMLGSAYYAQNPLYPLKDSIGGINFDGMIPVGRSKDLEVIGYGASQLEELLKVACDKRNMYLRPDTLPEKGFFYRSDHISLARKGVPTLYAHRGLDLERGGERAGTASISDYVSNHYHKPSDEYSEDWDVSGMIQAAEILRDVGAYMLYSNMRPNWYPGNEFRSIRDAQ